MEPIKIFVLSIDKDTLDKVLSFLRGKDFEADGDTDLETALESFKRKNYDIAVFGGGISGKTRELLKKEFTICNPEVEVIEHQSHPLELFDEIVEAFGE